MTEDELHDKDKSVDDAVKEVCAAAVGLIVIGKILADNGMTERKEDKPKPVVDMRSKTMRKSELKEMKRIARMKRQKRKC